MTTTETKSNEATDKMNLLVRILKSIFAIALAPILIPAMMLMFLLWITDGDVSTPSFDYGLRAVSDWWLGLLLGF